MCKYLHTEITSWMCSVQKVLISNISLLFLCLIGSNVSFPFLSTRTQFGKQPGLRLRSIPKQLCWFDKECSPALKCQTMELHKKITTTLVQRKTQKHKDRQSHNAPTMFCSLFKVCWFFYLVCTACLLASLHPVHVSLLFLVVLMQYFIALSHILPLTSTIFKMPLPCIDTVLLTWPLFRK